MPLPKPLPWWGGGHPLPTPHSTPSAPTKFGQLVLAKIIKIVATRCHILRLKCTKFDVGWGSAPDPTGSAPPDPLAGFKGAYFKVEGRVEEGGEGTGG